MKYKDGFPTDRELFDLSSFITDKWNQVGYALNLTNDQINYIDKNKNDKAHSMLVEWRNSTGSSSPYEDLYKALCHRKVEREKVAKSFCLMVIS